MTIVIILRGLPGSGKTTWANAFAAQHPGTVICSADHFFETPAGYQFDPALVSAAHHACRAHMESALRTHVPYILVDNTHTRKWEYEASVTLAKDHNAEIYQRVCTGEWPSMHNVPADTLAFMQQRFQPDDTLNNWREPDAPLSPLP